MRLHALASLVIAVCLVIVLGVGLAHAQSPPTGYTTEWRFTGDTNEFVDKVYGPGTLEYADGDDGATDESDIFGVTDGVTIPHINGVPTTYLNFQARATNAEGYLCRTGIDSLLGLDVRQFTMIFDVFIEVGNNDSYMGIWNGNATNSNDAELFLRPITGGYFADGANIPGTWLAGEWNRFVFVNDFSDADTFTMYLNGDPTPDFVSGSTAGRSATIGLVLHVASLVCGAAAIASGSDAVHRLCGLLVLACGAWLAHSLLGADRGAESR